MVNQSNTPWGCPDFQEDNDLKLLNGDLECEHYVIGTCYRDGQENFGVECPYKLEPRLG